ncbi:hypothetical protein HHL17_20170 [Chitinophaga sp. G-6-1-13]|uniref:Uncharacterized protein n=1 Tax=Chitinophaga fulva TaxID=2728842 RepID=A0A848GUX8_9BACT|nr:hypothetical protein [Chitinophaga fulva]NML39528.1 hypothetical protein [Chitinophaga fulva]
MNCKLLFPVKGPEDIISYFLHITGIGIASQDDGSFTGVYVAVSAALPNNLCPYSA